MNILQDLNCEMKLWLQEMKIKTSSDFTNIFFFTINIACVDVIATFHYLPSLQKNAWFLGKYNTITSTYSGADMTITHDFYIFFFLHYYIGLENVF